MFIMLHVCMNIIIMIISVWRELSKIANTGSRLLKYEGNEKFLITNNFCGMA